MKYSQFLELQNVLKDNNLVLEDVKENPDVLNEISVGSAILGIVTLGGLITFFGKGLLRLGIKKIYVKHIEKTADKFQEQILEHASALAKKSLEIRKNIAEKEKNLKTGGEGAKEELETLRKQKMEFERTFVRQLNESITKITATKSKEVYEKINELKKLKDSQKTGLKVAWDLKMPFIKMESFNKLIEEGIISDADIIKEIKADLKEELDENKKKAGKTLADLSKADKEEGKEGEKKEGDKKEKSEIQKIESNIDELVSEKASMSEEELNKKLRLIYKDIAKIKDIHQRPDLYQKLMDEFGEDKFNKIRKSVQKEQKEGKGEDQSILNKDDEL